MASPQKAPIDAQINVGQRGKARAPIKVPTAVIVTEPGIMVPMMGKDSANEMQNANKMPK